MARRISITKRQRETAAATDLIALCQTITGDGSLVEDEVGAMAQWLIDNAKVDLPAKEFLWVTVERIIADGKVTADERQELYEAIEKVLPRDVRDTVQERRRRVEEKEELRARAIREEARSIAAAAQARCRPVETLDFMVAGVCYEGRGDVIRRYVSPGDVVYLARDPANQYSSNAVEIRLSNGFMIGYVPEEDAVDVAPLLDTGHRHQAHVKKILTGRRVPIPVVVAEVYRPDLDEADGLLLPHEVPDKVAPTRELFPLDGGRDDTVQRDATGSGCRLATVLVASTVGLVLVSLLMMAALLILTS